MKFCLLGATFGTRNMGVNALTAGTIRCITNHDPLAEVVLLDYGKDSGRTYSLKVEGKTKVIHSVHMRFSKNPFQRSHIIRLLLVSLLLKFFPFAFNRSRVTKRNPCLRALNEADIVCSMAGGDSFSDIYGVLRFQYVTLPQVLALMMGKPLVQLPQSFGPYRNPILKSIASRILKASSWVLSREEGSVRALGKLLDTYPNVRFCHDVGFVLEPYAPAVVELGEIENRTGSCRVGLNVSGLLYMGGYNRRNMFSLKSDYRQLVSEVLTFLLDSDPGNLVVLIPHVFGTGKNSESDSAACEKVFEGLPAGLRGKRAFCLTGQYDQHEIKHIIGRCDFFIGARMHACIAALSQCIPAVGTAYSDKFRGVLASVQAASLVADLRKLDVKEVVGVIRHGIRKRSQYSSELMRIMPGIQRGILTDLSGVFESSLHKCSRISSAASGAETAGQSLDRAI